MQAPDTAGAMNVAILLVAPVAVVLPTLIVVTAVGSQLSAAVADDAACAGLATTLFGGHNARWSYLGIGVITMGLTWLTDVLQIISLASRAFALFYAVQCVVALLTARAKRDVPHRVPVMVGAGLMAALSLAIVVFGIPAE